VRTDADPEGIAVEPAERETLPHTSGDGAEAGEHADGHDRAYEGADVADAAYGDVHHHVDVDDTDLVRRRHLIRWAVDLTVLTACVVFIVLQLQPGLLIRDTTPAGGDMGAHVWAPAYLRDHLLPDLRLTGWTPDWYAGFPAFQFYMVVPSLVIVVLDAGIHGWLGLLPAAAGAGLVAVAIRQRHLPRLRNLAIVGAVVAFCLVGLSYGVAFKLVSVSGLVTLPLAAYAFARLADARFPTPAVMAVATLPFLFYRGFTIYGGNVPSTLAGEFAFSMSLSLGLVYLGVVIRGLRTGQHRALAAVLLALTGLCHLIPAFWVLAATAVAVLVRFRRSTAPLAPGLALVAGGAGVAGLAVVLGAPQEAAPTALALLGALALAAGLWLLSESVRWLTPTLVVGGLLAAFWVAPFYLRRAYLNDMGWEKLPNPDPDLSRFREWLQFLLPYRTPDVDLRWLFALAIVGAALSLALRLRIGVFLFGLTLIVGVAFVVIPEGRLWNGRLLPFYYLTVMLLAAVAVAETIRTVMQLARQYGREPAGAGAVTALGSLAAVLLVVGLPLGALPFSERTTRADGTVTAGYRWPSFSPWTTTATPESFVTSWARWNYTGYELKASYREYYDLVRTMEQVGEDEGCGRAFWEYERELDRYGTPMALMLLPHWTDGCIGSMEGLYFEASATTPFHFLTQVELSTNPSAAQRDLPYRGFDITKGVDHLQMMGVRYYMATSENAINQARGNPDLTEIAESGPWVIFEVADSDIVEPLSNQPAVVTGIDGTQRDWVEQPTTPDPNDPSREQFYGPAIQWFTDPSWWTVPLAADGPDDWQRVGVGVYPDAKALEPVEVTNTRVDDDGISFDVDRPGEPVLVKMSYFPNWEASGADGPYRVAPNFMVVIPTDTHVELAYGRTGVEWLSYGLTALGLVGLVLLVRAGTYAFSRRERRVADTTEPG
jgi:hypothetical protein